MQRIPSSDWETEAERYSKREREGEKTAATWTHVCNDGLRFFLLLQFDQKKNPNIQTTKPAAVFVSSVPTIARYLSTRPALFQ